MTGIAITTELVIFFIAVFGAIAGIWWRVEARIDGAKQAALLVAAEFAQYQTRVAETYITKQGLREQTEQVMGGISEIKTQVSHLNERIDGMITHTPRPARPRSQRSG